jgi:HEAT repeat protein
MTKRVYDPDLVRERAPYAEEYANSAAALLRELASAGFEVGTVADLHRGGRTPRAVVPILIAWLPTIENSSVRDDVVRALTDRVARPVAAAPLIAAFRREQDASVKWAIGNALSVVADESVSDDLIDLVRDKRHGISRQMIAVALGNTSAARAASVLVDLLGDDEVAGHAVMGLAKLKAVEARSALEAMKAHPKPWIRKEVAKALSKLPSK